MRLNKLNSIVSDNLPNGSGSDVSGLRIDSAPAAVRLMRSFAWFMGQSAVQADCDSHANDAISGFTGRCSYLHTCESEGKPLATMGLANQQAYDHQVRTGYSIPSIG